MKTENRICAVICTFNGLSRLPQVLDALIDSNARRLPDEIVVVDNNSSQDIKSFVAEYSKAKPLVKYALEERQGLMWARLRGLRVSTSEIVAFVDDDNYCDSMYIYEVGRIFESDVVGYSGFPTRLPVATNVPAELVPFLSSYAIGTLPYSEGLMDFPKPVWGAGLALRRDAMLLAIDAGYAVTLVGRQGKLTLAGDDTELCYILSMQGYQGYYSGASCTTHGVSLDRLCRSKLEALKQGFARSSGIIHINNQFLRHVRSGGALSALIVPLILGLLRATLYAFRDTYSLYARFDRPKYNLGCLAQLFLAHTSGLVLALRLSTRLIRNAGTLNAIAKWR